MQGRRGNLRRTRTSGPAVQWLPVLAGPAARNADVPPARSLLAGTPGSPSPARARSRWQFHSFPSLSGDRPGPACGGRQPEVQVTRIPVLATTECSDRPGWTRTSRTRGLNIWILGHGTLLYRIRFSDIKRMYTISHTISYAYDIL